MIVSRSLLRPLAAVSSRSASGGGAVVLRSAASASFALSPLVRARALSTQDASPTKAGPSGNGGGNSGGNSDGNDKGKEDGGHVRGTNLEFFVTTFLGAFLGAFIYRSMIEAASKSTAADQDGKNLKPKPESQPESDLDGALRALHDAFGGDAARISTDKDDLHHRGYSAWTYHPAALPSVVVWPQSVEECVRIVRIAAEYGCAIVPFAGGTSLESHFAALPPEQAEREGIPVKPTISVDFELMSDVLEFHPEDGDVVVQPGLKWEALNEWLAEHGSNLYWPVDPGPGAAFGGMLSTGGSGTNAVRFGTMKGDYVLNLTVVLPSGEVITTRPRTRKFATSPDMTKLFLGAEGTLGLIVAATLRLAPRLPTTVGRATFATVEDACGAVREMLAQGVGVQSIELMDDVMVRCVNRAEGGSNGSQTSLLPEQPTLFIRFMGTPAHTTEDERLALSIVRRFGADTLTVAREPAECERLWNARKVALWSAMEYRESVSLRSDLTRDGDQEAAAREREELGPVKCWTTDCCVPLGKLPEMVKRVKADIKEAGLVGPLVGHAGDGNVHALLTFRANDKAEFERVRSVASRMVEHAQSLGGTASGEHGVGLGKRQYVERELGRGTVDLLRLLKRTLDPENIFNPGKLYPPETKAKAST